MNLPITWSADDKVAWKTSIPGEGWSSPIVYKQYVFLTTATEEGVSCRVICVNRNDGRIAWNTETVRDLRREADRVAAHKPAVRVERAGVIKAVFGA